jgi:CelD/BcsL family acetyltransferase involved in cellulose biosynthesis
LNLEVIPDVPGLIALQREWSDLLDEVEVSSPFHFPEWLITWWSHFGSGRLHVLTFRTNRLIAVVPCFLHEWSGRMQLTLLGSGISDYLEPPILSRCTNAVLDALSTHLTELRDWDVLNWQDLSASSPLREMNLGSECELKFESDTGCSLVSLHGSFEEFWGTRPGHLRQNTRRDRAKAERKAALAFEVIERADNEILETVFNLHTARWQKQGLPGMVEANHSKDFLMQAAVALSARDMLRVSVLRIEQKIGAALLLLKRNATLYNYLTAFDPTYADLGLGRSLLFESFRYAFQHGYAEWDFLRGDEPYKRWWGGGSVPKCRVVATRTTRYSHPPSAHDRSALSQSAGSR